MSHSSLGTRFHKQGKLALKMLMGVEISSGDLLTMRKLNYMSGAKIGKGVFIGR